MEYKHTTHYYQFLIERLITATPGSILEPTWEQVARTEDAFSDTGLVDAIDNVLAMINAYHKGTQFRIIRVAPASHIDALPVAEIVWASKFNTESALDRVSKAIRREGITPRSMRTGTLDGREAIYFTFSASPENSNKPVVEALEKVIGLDVRQYWVENKHGKPVLDTDRSAYTLVIVAAPKEA